MANAAGLRDKVIRYGEAVVSEAVDRMMVDELREAAPLGETGDTRRGIDSVPGGSPTRPGSTVRSVGKGGDYVEEGTKPHVILPHGKALRFLAGSGRISTASPNQRIATRAGGVVFAKIVNHPGTPARPWFRPVVERFPEFLQRAAASIRF